MVFVICNVCATFQRFELEVDGSKSAASAILAILTLTDFLTVQIIKMNYFCHSCKEDDMSQCDVCERELCTWCGDQGRGIYNYVQCHTNQRIFCCEGCFVVLDGMGCNVCNDVICRCGFETEYDRSIDTTWFIYRCCRCRQEDPRPLN